MWFPPVPYLYRDEWLGCRLLQRHRTRWRRHVRYGDDTDIGSGEIWELCTPNGPVGRQGCASSSFVMANLLLCRSSSTARATSSVASPASSPSSSSTARRSLLSAARPSTSLASSSAPSVRYTFTPTRNRETMTAAMGKLGRTWELDMARGGHNGNRSHGRNEQ